MWLWAKYVKVGNIDKHCTACMIGSYSKKFAGTSNPKLMVQTTIVMDDVAEGQYETIYFCGVLKAGYLHKNPLKNNYQHNVHFAIRPVKYVSPFEMTDIQLLITKKTKHKSKVLKMYGYYVRLIAV